MKLIEFSKRFPDEASCDEYLKNHREKVGVVCKYCGGHQHIWYKYNKCWICKKCGHKTTLKADTVMHNSKLPLMYWLTAIHLLTSTRKTFSALEMQRQLGHKRYQPIWKMMHKLRSVMGQRDTTYQLSESIELNEAFFSTENSDEAKKQKERKAGQRKSKVLVMIESEAVPENKQKKDRKSGYIKMKVVPDVQDSTITEVSKVAVAADSIIITDDSKSHTKLKGGFKEVYPIKTLPEQASKILPWVHTAISNAKSLLLDMYHGIKDEFLQSYLDEFCWKFNRRSFGDRLFDRLVVAAVSYRPMFQHRAYV